MDTLRRVGSLRLSRRGRKKEQDNSAAATLDSKLSPSHYPTSHKGPVAPKAYFTVSCKDVLVSTLNGYQPTHIKTIVERRRKNRASEPMLWEPSLKCTSTGSAVWHPPFIVTLAITVPKFAKGTLLRHKDAYISIENLDAKKGKKKLLAKARLNLSDYFESAAEKDVSFRLKLHPESSKVASASVDLTIRKSVRDPATADSGPCLDEDDTGSLSDERLLAPSHRTPGSTPRGSRGDLDRGDDEEDLEEATADKRKSKIIDSPVKALASPVKIVPNIATPPPLPPRGGKLLSQDSPPNTPNGIRAEHLVTSTPLPPKTNGLSLPLLTGATIANTVKKSPNKLKEIDWNDEAAADGSDKELEAADHAIGINLPAACASPKIMKSGGSMRSSAEKDLIEWARASLANTKPQVKVTNLTSSWRNGLGFCAILYKAYPSLIPLEDLSSDNVVENNEIAFDAADILGVDTSSVRGMSNGTDKSVVSGFLNDLRGCLEDGMMAIDDETVICFQKKWFVRGKYFRKEVGHLVKEEKAGAAAIKYDDQNDDDGHRPQDDGRINSSCEDSSLQMASVETTQPSSPPLSAEQGLNDEAAVSGPSTVTSSPAKELSSRERVKKLIAAAHDSSSYDDESVSSSGREVIGQLAESMTILEELSELAREEEQISSEIEKLEAALRSQDKNEVDDESDFEAMLQRYVSLVNEKNSVVRRQMQLNLAEKERAIEHKKVRLQRQLQKFSDLDDSQKTEAMRMEEEKILNQYVEAVNAKNELVHDLDSQEKLIAEDERIKAFIANRDTLTQSSRGKHNIMDEFLDFFKKK